MVSINNYSLLSRLVAASVNISNKSARILRDIKKSGELNIQEKAANDYVTRADFLSQLNIIKSLEKMFPKIKFCGEEGDLRDDNYNDLETTLNKNVLDKTEILPKIYNTIKEEDLFIWVDPLDGTKEYTKGPEYSKEVTILIGISWKGNPIAGVINQPFFEHKTQKNSLSGRYLWGVVGLGAFDSINGKICSSKKFNKSNCGTTKLITTRSHLSDLIKRDLNKIPNSQLVTAGGCGFKALQLIDGNVDCYIYPSKGTKKWDTCAVEAIVTSLDGNFTDIFGNKYNYSFPTETHLVENLFGIISTFNEPTNKYSIYISDELKIKLLKDAEKLKKNNIFKK